MTTEHEMERIVRSWLEPGLTTLTDDVLDPVLDQLPATPQRRPVWPPRRIRYLSSFAKFSLAATALVVVAIVGINLASRSGQPFVGATASPSPSVVPTIAPSDCVDLYADGGTYRATVGTIGVMATVPAGWHGLGDQFYLSNAPCLFGSALNLEVALVSRVYADSCHAGGTGVEATSPAAVTAALGAQEGHETTGPTEVTIGGYPANRFELSFPVDFDDTACDDGTMRLFPDDPEGHGIYNIDPGTTMTVDVVDIDGSSVVVAARVWSEDATPVDTDELAAIVESLSFEPSDVGDVSPSPSVAVTSPPAPPSDAGSGSLPVLGLPGNAASPAGEYGWESGPGVSRGMHKVRTNEGSTELTFGVRADCFERGTDQQARPVRVAGLDGVSVEPYEPPVTFGSSEGDETTRAYALAVGDRTLCVYLTWHPTTTESALEAGAQIVESIRAEPIGVDRIRITFTLDEGWDVG